MSNAEKIQQWRDENPSEVLTGATLRGIIETDLPYADLHRANLRGASLPYTDLHRANLRGADLRLANLTGTSLLGANLRGASLSDVHLTAADLSGAIMYGANLRGANLIRANLSGADLYGADLRSTNAGILTIDGAHPYRVELVPTPYGWALTIGCWSDTIDELRALIAKDEGWPEATGEEIEKLRPILEAVAVLCDAHIKRHTGLIEDLAKRWIS